MKVCNVGSIERKSSAFKNYFGLFIGRMKSARPDFQHSKKNEGKEGIMFCRLRGIILVFSVLVCSLPAYGQEISREQIKGLDEQVQEIKSDVLSIAEELKQLEEKLLYPSNTQVAVFVSLASGETFRLDSVELQLDGKPVVHHIYTFKELEALRKGGVQRIYSGNVRTGAHDLQVSVMGKSEGGNDFRKMESFTVNKAVGPKIVEVALAAEDLTFKDR